MKRPSGFDGRTQPPADPAPSRPQRTRGRRAEKAASAPTPPPEPVAPVLPIDARVAKPGRDEVAAESAARVPAARGTIAEQPTAPVEPIEAETAPILLPHGDAAPTAVDAATEAHPVARGRLRSAREQLKRAERDRRRRERQEQRRFTGHLRARRLRWIAALSAVLGLALFVVAGVFTPVMAVRDIQIQGAQAVNSDDLQQALSRFEGVPIALVSDADVHRALEPFLLIQRYAIERIPPHTLIVRIEERSAVISLDRGDGFELLDPAGVLLGKVAEPPAGVPLGNPELADTASPAFLAASAAVRDMPDDLRQQLVSVRASNAQDVAFVLSGGTEVVWGEAKEAQRKAAVLRSMLSSMGALEMIDVTAPNAPVYR